jgi:hypothetical protein
LLGIDFWESLSDIEKRLANLCMKHFAEEEGAELYDCNPDGEPSYVIR